MPPRASTSNNGFRGTGPFKPPRPTGRSSDNAGSSSSAAAATSRRIEISDDDENDKANNENDENENDVGADTEVATDNEDTTAAAAAPSEPAIPPALLSRLLSHFFQNPKGTPTRMTQDAHASIDKYMEIFIREAVARSVAARTDEAFLDVRTFSPRMIALSPRMVSLSLHMIALY